MPATSIQSPFPIFTDIDGQPLEQGQVWLGTAGNNPISSPITAYWDAALTQVVTQPVTTRGGYPMNGSAVGRLYVNSDFSILVRNRSGYDVLSALSATERYDSSLVTFVQAGAGAVVRTAQAKMRDTVSVKDFGAVGDGVTNDTAAIQAAIAASTNKTLFWPTGQYLLSAPQVISQAVSWAFEGPTGPLLAIPPTTRIIKAASVAGDLLTFTGQSVVLGGIAVVGQPGNTGDGIVLRGNSPYLNRPFVAGMGRDGIRLGTDSVGSNVNSFTIINARCLSNGRDGIHISEVTINANSGSFVNPICTQNGRHGFYGNKAALGVTISGPLFEANTGHGAYLDTFFGYIGANVIIGGDIEANVAGNLYEAVPFQTEFVGVSVQGKTINSRAQNGSYVPVLTGGSSAGTATYSVQQGSYAIAGGSVNFYASLAWSGHTGTGQAYINLPLPCYPVLPVPDFFPVLVSIDGIALGAGYRAEAFISRAGSRVQLYQSNQSIPALGSLSVTTSGTIYISGSYPANVPNFNYL